MLNYNIDFDNRQVIYQEILVSNALRLGALAWRGYQLKSKGVILVYALNESQAALVESIHAEICYLSKEEALQSYPEAIGLFQLVDEYDPNNEMVVTFAESQHSLVESYCLSLDIPPLNCYILEQERLLSM